jgi:micrococcal nuclease
LVRSFRTSNATPAVLLALLSLLSALAVLASPHRTDAQAAPVVRVVRIIDGDTIEVCCLAGRPEKVRYIGVNTPETKHPTKGVEAYGKEAKESNRKLVTGKTVRLEFDVQERDRHGRLLAYVYLEDGTFVNAWLVAEGFAQVMTVPPNVKHQELFLKFQREAREARRGLWR